jgi:hypothetical protein
MVVSLRGRLSRGGGGVQGQGARGGGMEDTG